MLFHQLLELGSSWEVVALSVREADGTVEIEIRETNEFWKQVKCADDGAELSAYDHGQERRWRHLNIFEYRCEIVCRLPRGKCRRCGNVRSISAPWEGFSKGFTIAFEAMRLLLMRDMPAKRADAFVGEHDTRLWRLLNRHVEKARKDKKMDALEAICCDELSIRKGQLNLQDIYRIADSFGAHHRLKAWIRWTRQAARKNPLLAPMARVGRTLDKHRDGTLAHWDNHATNAFMEGLMSVFSATKRKARGYRSFEYLRSMLYFTSSKLNIPFQRLFHCK